MLKIIQSPVMPLAGSSPPGFYDYGGKLWAVYYFAAGGPPSATCLGDVSQFQQAEEKGASFITADLLLRAIAVSREPGLAKDLVAK